MKIIVFFTVVLFIGSCSQEYICDDSQITPVFVKFQQTDIDTFIVRKFKADGTFTNQLDSNIIVLGYSGYYSTSNDTTIVRLGSGTLTIQNGFDWQIFIHAKNRKINISEIISEKRTENFHYGFLNTNKVLKTCINRIFSCNQENQKIAFDNTEYPFLYINN